MENFCLFLKYYTNIFRNISIHFFNTLKLIILNNYVTHIIANTESNAENSQWKRKTKFIVRGLNL